MIAKIRQTFDREYQWKLLEGPSSCSQVGRKSMIFKDIKLQNSNDIQPLPELQINYDKTLSIRCIVASQRLFF
jgi:hypothetical protein